MRHKKITFVIIIILLIIFVPLAIFSTTMHYLNREEIGENNAIKTQEFKHEGKLYFYNKEDLIGTYTCENFNDYCDYATNKTSYEYELDEYKLGSKEKIVLINNRYAFLIDSSVEKLSNANIILYDVVKEEKVRVFSELKNYGGIENNTYIVKDTNGLWGVLEFSNEEIISIPFAYNYIGLANQIDKTTNLFKNDCFAVLENKNWSLVDSDNNKLTNFNLNNIYSYNEDYIITSIGGKMQLLDYKGVNILSGNYKYLNFYDKYLVVIDNDDIFYLYDLENEEKLSRDHIVTDVSELSFETENNMIKIYISEDLSETIAIS